MVIRDLLPRWQGALTNERFALEGVFQRQVIKPDNVKLFCRIFDNGYISRFPKAHVFHNVQNVKNKYLRNNGHNGCFNQYNQLKMTHVYLISSNYI